MKDQLSNSRRGVVQSISDLPGGKGGKQRLGGLTPSPGGSDSLGNEDSFDYGARQAEESFDSAALARADRAARRNDPGDDDDVGSDGDHTRAPSDGGVQSDGGDRDDGDIDGDLTDEDEPHGGRGSRGGGSAGSPGESGGGGSQRGGLNEVSDDMVHTKFVTEPLRVTVAHILISRG